MEFLTIKKDGPAALMTWNHEEQNRFTTPFLKEVLANLDELERDDAVRGVVITGAQEKYFSTGLHLEWMMAEGARDPEAVGQFLALLNRFLTTLTGYGKPLIAALNGHSVGAGAICAACMDYRYMAADRGFVRLPEVQINIPFWPGMRAIFQEILPPRSIRDMFYSGDRYTGEQAMAMGFIDALHPREELAAKALEMAARLGQAQHDTYASIKRSLRSRVLRIMKEEDPVAVTAFVKRMKAAKG